jgi:sugar/nucleoside kinase (ribokinase family)
MSKEAGKRTVFDVLGVGCNAVDYLCLIDAFPEEDTKMAVDTIETQGGGNVATGLVAVARLGGRAAFHAVIGNDEHRDEVIARLEREKINTDYVITKEGSNALACILINRQLNTRTIMYCKRTVPAFPPEEFNDELVQRSKVLLIDFYFPEASLRAAKAACELGLPVVIDAEKPSYVADAVLENCSHVIASRGFALNYTETDDGTGDKKLLMNFSECIKSPFVCITLGDRGAIAYERKDNRIYMQDAFAVEVVDTTGAGDVLHGAFAYFISLNYSSREALRWASACAAMKCRELGGRKGIPTMNQLKKFMADR